MGFACKSGNKRSLTRPFPLPWTVFYEGNAPAPTPDEAPVAPAAAVAEPTAPVSQPATTFDNSDACSDDGEDGGDGEFGHSILRHNWRILKVVECRVAEKVLVPVFLDYVDALIGSRCSVLVLLRFWVTRCVLQRWQHPRPRVVPQRSSLLSGFVWRVRWRRVYLCC